MKQKNFGLEIKTPENPVAANAEAKAIQTLATPSNFFGVNSIQDFSGIFGNHNNDLKKTHGDAQGFYNYLLKFYTPNFWYKDGNVQTWQYEEPYDHWQNLYGVDAVLAFYHSGHGNMDSNGVFQAPMGGKWNDETWYFSNNKVLFGNQVCRYIFWSTCFSCRFSNGNSPIRTWFNSDSNPGFRMLFGYDSTSIDSPNYGSNFWSHWNKNESFSTAWLNASWDIYHNQVPSCVGSGATQAEANDRVFNERLMYGAAVSRNWYAWRWYNASTKAIANKALPKTLKIAEFDKATFTEEHAHQLAATLKITAFTSITKEGEYSIAQDKKLVSVNSLGHLNAKLADINHLNKTQLSEKEALKIAEANIQQHNLHAGEKYELDVIKFGKTASSSTEKNAIIENEYVSDTMVQYRQIINGVPVVNTDAGLIRVSIDNDGTVTNLHSSVKKIASLHTNAKNAITDPSGKVTTAEAKAAVAIEADFSQALKDYKKVKLVASSEEVGYDVAYTHGRVVVSRVYEITMEKNLKKLVKIIVPIYE